MVAVLQWSWEWQYSVQREGQAHSPTKSEWDSADVKAYRAYGYWDYEKQMG